MVGAVDPGDLIAFDGSALLMKEARILPSIAYSEDDFASALIDLRAMPSAALSIIESVVPLDATADSLMAMAKPGGPVKVQVAPGA
jgi:hypothetical protein